MTNTILSLTLVAFSGALTATVFTLIADRRKHKNLFGTDLTNPKLALTYSNELYKYLDSPDYKYHPYLPSLNKYTGRYTLTTLIVDLMTHLNGEERLRLQTLFRESGLETMLCHDICTAKKDITRAKLLQFYSEIVPTFDTLKQITGYLSSDNTDVRLHTLLAHINYCPEKTAALLARYPHDLPQAGQKCICQLLAARSVPIIPCCEQLLSSDKKNCILLGLNIIAYFNLTNYQSKLSKFIDSLDPNIRDHALRVMIAIRFNKIDSAVFRALNQMDEKERKRFYRMLVRAHFSTNILSSFAHFEGDSSLGIYLSQMISGHSIPLHPKAVSAN